MEEKKDKNIEVEESVEVKEYTVNYNWLKGFING